MSAQPTRQDIRNAELRQRIADRFRQEYDACQALATQAFGPDWEPSQRHYLLDIDEEERCRHTAERPVPAATVFTVKNAGGQQRHFTVSHDGKVTEHASVNDAFAPMLIETHPTRTIEVRGQQVHPHRYSLCWAPIELYEPRSAEQLAAARQRRQERALEQEAQQTPLFADLIRADGQVPSKRGRTPLT